MDQSPKAESTATDSEKSERGVDQSSSLLAMLVGGLILIVAGAIIVMTFV